MSACSFSWMKNPRWPGWAISGLLSIFRKINSLDCHPAPKNLLSCDLIEGFMERGPNEYRDAASHRVKPHCPPFSHPMAKEKLSWELLSSSQEKPSSGDNQSPAENLIHEIVYLNQNRFNSYFFKLQ